ncbi:MAG: PAS domain-containing protein [Hyphomicrobiaceae bacterium]
MVGKELEFLLKAYRFYTAAAEQRADAMPTGAKANMRRERNEVFAQLLTFQSENAKIIAAQLTALIDCLAGTSQDSRLARFVTDACRDHIGRLAADRAEPPVNNPFLFSGPVIEIEDIAKLGEEHKAQLNASPDRIALVDSDYRYVFANAANAGFHGIAAKDFVGRPLWTLTCEKFLPTSAGR